MPFEFFPNTNFHDLNLDYILEKAQKIDDNLRDSQASADAAKASEEAAAASEDAALLSQVAAAASEAAAKDYADHIADPVSGLVTDWLEENITQETGYVLDASLTSAAAAAPAKTVGDKAIWYRGYIPTGTAFDCNDALDGFYILTNSAANHVNTPFGDMAGYIITFSNDIERSRLFKVQYCIPTAVQSAGDAAYHVYWRVYGLSQFTDSTDPGATKSWTAWRYLSPLVLDDVGSSTTGAISQNAFTNLGLVFKGYSSASAVINYNNLTQGVHLIAVSPSSERYNEPFTRFAGYILNITHPGYSEMTGQDFRAQIAIPTADIGTPTITDVSRIYYRVLGLGMPDMTGDTDRKWSAWRPINTEKYLEGKSFSIIGDSISTYAGWIPSDHATYYPNSATNVTRIQDTWWYKICSAYHAKLLYNDSWSGSTVSTDNANGPMVNRVDTSLGSARVLDPKPDIIFVFGGTNDANRGVAVGSVMYSGWTDSDLAKFAPAYCKMLDTITTYNPGAKICCMVGEAFTAEMKTAVTDAAAHYGASVIDLGDYDNVGLHPTRTGMTEIYNRVVNALFA